MADYKLSHSGANVDQLLTKAGTAVQPEDLGTAAYAATSAFDASGAANSAYSAIKSMSASDVAAAIAAGEALANA